MFILVGEKCYHLSQFQAVEFCSEMGIAMTIEDSWGGNVYKSDVSIHPAKFDIFILSNNDK